MKNIALKKPRRPVDEALRANRTEQILDAAARLFAKHGYADADTQLLADELGVGKGTLYRYFPSKMALFLAAADRVMRRLRAEIDGRIKDVADPLDRIAVAIRTFLEFFAANPDFVELLMQERAQFKDRKEPTYFQHRKVNVERWKDLYRQLMAEGRIRAMPVERITDVLSDLVYGTMFSNYFTGNEKAFEAQAGDILDIVFHGILSERERACRKPE
ncbi:MAG TPA: TetR/AcrR family transcriptional regulator [Gemmataceae bacterium]|jgi:AcrR family transcriptional regulator|nr:TetR/AcrR family transcriptional regulator [Gemmataceae bacterium]